MRFIRPEDRKAPAITIKPGPSRKLRPHSSHKKGVRDIGKPITIVLKCGHFTTPEEVEVYRHWQTEPHRYFCEQCGKWRDKENPPEVKELPWTPLF